VHALRARLQDFLTAAYLLTAKDAFYSRAELGLFVCAMGDAADAVELPLPALAKPLELWTGKQLFSLLIRPSSRAKCAAASACWASHPRPAARLASSGACCWARAQVDHRHACQAQAPFCHEPTLSSYV
jgi:hypothetical protein